MRQILVNENNIREAVRKILSEMDLSNVNSNPFNKIENEVREKHAEISNQIEALENTLSQLDAVIPALNEADKEVKSTFEGIQGPQIESYNYIAYKFAQPVEYNGDESYDEKYEYLEDTVKEMFPEIIRKAVSVYVDYDRKNNYAYNGFKISIDLDELQGWY